MATAEWERVRTLLESALELPLAERPSLLASETDPEVRRETEALLLAYEDAGQDFLGKATYAELFGLDSRWIGRRIAAYEVIGELGEGGMGTVLLAVRGDRMYDRRVAIKIIRADMSGENFVVRFRREIRILAGFDHPAITRLLDAGLTDENLPYLVMEYVDGEPIDAYCRKHNPDAKRIIEFAIATCQALGYAHAKGVVHRDVKPSNLLITADGSVKLLDFGIAKLAEGTDAGPEQTATQMRAITPAYASLEQIAGREATVRSDVFSLGVVLYTLIAGAAPFAVRGLSIADIQRTIAETEPVAPSRVDNRASGELPRGLDSVILKAIRPDPAQRYASMAEFSADLTAVLAGQPPDAGARVYAIRRWTHRRRRLLAATVAATVIASSGYYAVRHHWIGAAAAAPAGTVRPSVAIMPFSGLSGASGWIPSALGEMLQTELSATNQIRLTEANAVAQALRDTHVPNLNTADQAAAARIARASGADYLIDAAVRGEPGTLHVEARLIDGRTGAAAAASALDGSSSDLAGLAHRLGVALSASLPISGAITLAPSLMPTQPEAIRAYVEGELHLQALNYVAARDSFDEAARAEPDSALVHAGLSQAWTGLGYHANGIREAGEAVRLSSKLPRRARLAMEGEYDEMQKNWAAAAEVYRTLFEFFPEEIDYGLELGESQMQGGDTRSAMATADSLGRLPAPLGSDPRIYLLRARIEHTDSHFKEAVEQADEAIRMAHARGAQELEARATLQKARSLHQLGDDPHAAEMARLAMATFQSSGDQRMKGEAANVAGTSLDMMGQNVAAQKAFDEALAIFKSIDFKQGIAAVELAIGIRAAGSHDYAGAQAHMEEARRISAEIGDVRQLAMAEVDLGGVAVDMGKGDIAIRLFTRGLKSLREAHDDRGVAGALTNLATELRIQGKMEEAARDFEEEIRINRAAGQFGPLSYGLDGLCTLDLQLGHFDQARQLCSEAIEDGKKASNPAVVLNTTIDLSQVLKWSGDLAGARRLVENTLASMPKVDDPSDKLGFELTAASVALDQNDASKVEPVLQDVLAQAEKMKEPETEMLAHVDLAHLRVEQGRGREAKEQIEAARLLISPEITQESRYTYGLLKADVDMANGELQSAAADLKQMEKLAEQRKSLVMALAFRANLAVVHERMHLPEAQAEWNRARAEARAMHCGFVVNNIFGSGSR